MRTILLVLLLNLSTALFLGAQETLPDTRQIKDISSLIDTYSKAREKGDTVLLKRILTKAVDQLVSTGEWRNGRDAAVEGMQKSSGDKPGRRTLTIEKIRMLDKNSALVDCRYEIQNPGGTVRKMWSTFILVASKGIWKITAIRNMLPEARTTQHELSLTPKPVTPNHKRTF